MPTFCGLDLSGPSNTKDTTLTWFESQDSSLSYIDHITDINDETILSQIESLANKNKVILGIDAPLSYNDGGGNRPRDNALRKFLNKAGLDFIGILPPTFSRMGWLTMRGIRLTREITGLSLGNPISILEVHPGAALGLRGAPVHSLQQYKKDETKGCLQLKGWFSTQNITGLPDEYGLTSHEIDAVAAALAAWQWQSGKSIWRYEADPPLHPFEFIV